jgi:hypothetical protein
MKKAPFDCSLGNFIEYNSSIKEVCTKLIMWIWILKTPLQIRKPEIEIS